MIRLCRLNFHRDIKIQVDGSVKTRKRGDEMILIELGNVESFGRDHWSGVISSDIQNVGLLKRNIEKLENIDPLDRLEWFELNFPKATIVKIEAAQMVDRSKSKMKNKLDQDYAVSIDSAIKLVWE